MFNRLKYYLFIFQDPLKIYLIIISAGLLVRLILMPLAVNLDTLLASWWESLWVFKGQIIIEDINEVILTIWMRIFKPLFVSFPSIIDIPNSLGILGIPEHAIFSSSDRAMRFIFLLKVPYLLVDFVLLFFVLKFFKDRRQKIIGLVLWAFNPFLLYSVYIYGLDNVKRLTHLLHFVGRKSEKLEQIKNINYMFNDNVMTKSLPGALNADAKVL